MAGPIGAGGATPSGSTGGNGASYAKALSLLASLFFMWGFITVINGVLLPHLRSVFELNYTQTALLEFAWFIAYGIAGWPSAKLIERVGYQRAISIGLTIMAAGALGMTLAASIPSYGVTLFMLFVIASGITLLQVAANPYVTVIGPPETGSARLNLVQAFNSLGTTLAPLFAGYLILGRSQSGTAAAGATITQAQRYADAQSVILPYVLVAIVLVVLAVVIARFPLPALGAATQRAAKEDRHKHSLWKHRNLTLGIPTMIAYLLAEIGVANLFVNFVSQPEIAAITHEQASRYLALLWGGMMVGRFVGSFLMQKIAPERLLGLFAFGALAVVTISTFATGPIAMWSLIAVGLFHSIMFPTIFTLAIRGLGPLTEEGSGLMIMAIAGGALFVIQGWLADHYGLQNSFFLTMACEIVVLAYALWGSKPTVDLGTPQAE
jgi:FHS family L-fucose permease-like MFS transporter